MLVSDGGAHHPGPHDRQAASDSEKQEGLQVPEWKPSHQGENDHEQNDEKAADLGAPACRSSPACACKPPRSPHYASDDQAEWHGDEVDHSELTVAHRLGIEQPVQRDRGAREQDWSTREPDVRQHDSSHFKGNPHQLRHRLIDPLPTGGK